ncbi:APC family permease [Sinomonas sp. JGH33]|uniref:APC family permease n=1 Tax=Sinomonas terricola TaxID=3110330 RepID=A0ABU5T785_9MICC|nr:APC family permease [Sinomonas sp. JGH33]MEA5455369.1 APC family permease [Sinomonas sp. JGH33]
MTAQGGLRRELGTFDATAIGLGSMLGAGVFAAFGPAAALAGPWLLVSLVLAGAVAYCNAVASAALAARYPHSGGAYLYGRRELGEWAGFLAGWGFVTGKSASCAAMALTFARYVAPEAAVPVAIAAVAGLTAVNLFGVARTAFATKVLVAVVLVVLAFATAAGLSVHVAPATTADDGAGPPWPGTLSAAGVLFFAFAGYARIATLGEEVRDPRRTIPRAILGALAGALAVYAVLAVVLLRGLGPAQLAGSAAPLADLVAPLGGWARALVGFGAACACLGALLALVAGIGRTSLAMAREGDLPRPLASIGARHSVPWVAELAAAAVVVVVLVATSDLLTVVSFSGFGVLVYYAVANAAAFRLGARPGYAPRWLAATGFAGCVILTVTLPWRSVLAMAAVLAAGLLARAAVLALRRRRG